jgi:mRNA interferase MazF
LKEGDIILTPLPQADGKIKNRPAVYLREMPPFRDALVCGVSTQIHKLAPDFDDLIIKQDSDFPDSGLVTDSLIRLGFLTVLPRRSIIGSIGSISPERHRRLLSRLSEYLVGVGQI